ncbi:MAG TPA: ABC transporter permease subunit [Dehalococcoidia bacterium]|nr:ABC transporter permease subunit [Dehalococcoidia bacterium]
MPGLVIALSLVFVAKNVTFLYQTFFVLITGYVLLFLPQATGAIRVSMGQMQQSIQGAARGLGAGDLRVMSSITFPLIRRGAIAGFVLVFITTIKELPATLILSPLGYQSLSVSVWSASSEAFFARAALPGLLLVLFSLVPLMVLNRWDRSL